MIEVIAEIANAHQGNYKTAIKLAKQAFSSGADAVKFQIYFADELLVKSHARYKHFLNQSFSLNQWKSIFLSQQNKKIYCDIFGIKALNVAIKYKVYGVKIHSSDLENLELIKKIPKKMKVLLSCGGSNLFTISKAVKILNSNRIKPVLMHGFQAYPTNIQDINFNRLKLLFNQFKNNVSLGFQDHTSGSDKINFYLPVLAMGIGAKYIEKHITFDRKKKLVDYYSSIEPKKLAEFVKIIRDLEKTFYLKKDNFSNSEKNYARTTNKNWVAKKNIKKGQKLNLSNLVLKRVDSNRAFNIEFESIKDKKTKKSILKDQKINSSDLRQKVCAFVSVRSDSKRLKNKWKLKICGKESLYHLVGRLKISKLLDDIVICTTNLKNDNQIYKFAKKNKIKCFRGSELDVLERMLQAAKKFGPFDHLVRVTGDDILIDNHYLDIAINHHLDTNSDYTDHKRLPSGTETEIFSYTFLKRLNRSIMFKNDTEYLTSFVTDHKDQFKISSAPVNKKHQSKISMTMDTKKDFLKVRNFLEWMNKKNKLYNYSIDDVMNFLRKLDKNKYQNIKKKNYKPKTTLNWNIYK
tara:strand:- start:178 stop:1908 length:1731 start_codon:yes stop_codon:yes gene_type:complete